MELPTLDDAVASLVQPVAGVPAHLPESFGQGKGIFGGLVFAAMVRAIEARSTAPLRTLSVDMCAPVQAGIPTALEIRCVKRGRASSFWHLELSQNGGVVSQGLAFSGERRSGDLDGQWDPQPSMVPADALPEMNFSPAYPEFLQHFDMRPAWGGLPAAGKVPESGGYLKLRRPSERFDKASMAACIDAWFPSFYVIAARHRPAATVSFAMTFHDDEVEMRPDDYVALCVQSQRMSGGYAVETNRLWAPSGVLLAFAIQTIAVLK